MDQPETYDVWAISDARGAVLYLPVATGAPVSPGDLIAQHRQQAARGTAPEGLIEGVWDRARRRLARPSGQLAAEVADPEVPAGRAAQRAATMARGADAVAWAPDTLLEPPERAPRPARRPAVPRKRAAASPPRPRPAPKPAPPPEPEEVPCRRCFMLRRPDQLADDGTCLDGCL